MKAAVYYHVWTPPDSDLWKIMVDDQIKRLYVSGLPEIATVKCAINGAQASRIKHFISLYDWIDIVDCRDGDEEYEGFCLKHLYEDCKDNKFDKVMYFHTRFSTNTEPQPSMAQPFRFIAHNGELNTDKKNKIYSLCDY